MQPQQAKIFRFLDASYSDGVVQLTYAFDDSAPLVERITFPDAPALPEASQPAFQRALGLLHLVAGISYYKAGVPPQIELASGTLDTSTADLLDSLYLHGLGEFAYRNKLDLHGRIAFPRCPGSASSNIADASVANLNLPPRTLVPIGGGKDSVVAIEALKSIEVEATAVWVGHSPLIASCAWRTGLDQLNIQRELAPELFEFNKRGAWNGHIPVTAINSAIMVVAAVLYGFDSIAFANERSASSATLEYAGRQVNHQWSKGDAFETMLAHWIHTHVAKDLDYCSLLRPYSELAITRAFARLTPYFDVFSSCNRNFRILGSKPDTRWCGQCPKCHFVFLALAPFLAKPRLLTIFGYNLLDDSAQMEGFDALLEYDAHKPFECVGEGGEARAAMYALSQRPEWREDILVQRFRKHILPQLDKASLDLEPWLYRAPEHNVPERLQGVFDIIER